MVEARSESTSAVVFGLMGIVFPFAAGSAWTQNVYGQSIEDATNNYLVYEPFHLRLRGTVTPYSLECTANDVSDSERRYSCTYHFKEFEMPATTSFLFPYDPTKESSLVRALDKLYLHGNTTTLSSSSLDDHVKDRLPLEEQDFHQTFQAAVAARTSCTISAFPGSHKEITLMRLECP